MEILKDVFIIENHDFPLPSVDLLWVFLDGSFLPRKILDVLLNERLCGECPLADIIQKRSMIIILSPWGRCLKHLAKGHKYSHQYSNKHPDISAHVPWQTAAWWRHLALLRQFNRRNGKTLSTPVSWNIDAPTSSTFDHVGTLLHVTIRLCLPLETINHQGWSSSTPCCTWPKFIGFQSVSSNHENPYRGNTVTGQNQTIHPSLFFNSPISIVSIWDDFTLAKLVKFTLNCNLKKKVPAKKKIWKKIPGKIQSGTFFWGEFPYNPKTPTGLNPDLHSLEARISVISFFPPGYPIVVFEKGTKWLKFEKVCKGKCNI